ncbi:MAG: hypothetical protein Q8P20_01125 [bacterium]|nr:hypothetical protein [bacterium]
MKFSLKSLLESLKDLSLHFYYFIRVSLFLVLLYPGCIYVYLVFKFIGSDKKSANLFWRQN